ncbi:hypothetical protein I7I50_04608 [Histoplasma capsulatum G186AR]|nr:hypothetical protein I7I52_05517 [Histoplasma capsulatum]QSS75468.1 hypothetical protein I7I50_04608 [Histoplasma capsulatum G186AR]
MPLDNHPISINLAFIQDVLSKQEMDASQIADLEQALKQAEASNLQERSANAQLLERSHRLQRDLAEVTIAKETLENQLAEVNRSFNYRHHQYETTISQLKSEIKAHRSTIDNLEGVIISLKDDIEVHVSTIQFLEGIAADMDGEEPA